MNEVIELEKVFATISDRAVCKLNEEKWKQALGGCFPDSYAERLFAVFDENRDGQIDFRELVCTLSALCRGPLPGRISREFLRNYFEKLKSCFRVGTNLGRRL